MYSVRTLGISFRYLVKVNSCQSALCLRMKHLICGDCLVEKQKVEVRLYKGGVRIQQSIAGIIMYQYKENEQLST